VEFLVGAALFVNHRVARRDGLFDEAFYFTGEEADLCLRLKRRGLRMVYYPDLEIMHYVSAGDVHRCFHVLNYLKSLKVFVRKYALLYYPVLYSLMILYVLKSILALTARYAIKRNMYSKTAAKRYWLILQWLLHLKEESQVLRDGACQ
jgi:GT2 family glycosyltransferase